MTSDPPFDDTPLSDTVIGLIVVIAFVVFMIGVR